MIAVAVTAAVTSPPVRRVLRRGAVYGLAGLLIARDKISGAAREIAHAARQTTEAAGAAAPEPGPPASASRVMTS